MNDFFLLFCMDIFNLFDAAKLIVGSVSLQLV